MKLLGEGNYVANVSQKNWRAMQKRIAARASLEKGQVRGQRVRL